MTALLESELLLRDAGRALGARDTARDDGGTRSGPFGSWEDLHAAHERYTALAVVFFSQIFNPGNRAEDVAAGNRDNAVKNEREAIVSACFSTVTDRAAFDALLTTILKARDQVIAHADGASFDINHSEYAVASDTHYECLSGIDIPAWRAAIAKLSDEITRRNRALGVGTTITHHSIKL
jgi:hypothetical protein